MCFMGRSVGEVRREWLKKLVDEAGGAEAFCQRTAHRLEKPFNADHVRQMLAPPRKTSRGIGHASARKIELAADLQKNTIDHEITNAQMTHSDPVLFVLGSLVSSAAAARPLEAANLAQAMRDAMKESRNKALASDPFVLELLATLDAATLSAAALLRKPGQS